MKKTLFTLSIATCISLSAQKKDENIVNSTNITEIENFLKTAHPDDFRRMILKRKIVALKNDQWMKNSRSSYAQNSANNNPSTTISSTAKQANFTVVNNSEEEEYKRLITESSKVHKEKTVRLLNQLFDNDVSNDNAILLIKNNGDCNMIVRIQGNEQYKLAVPARGENFVTVKKGNYQLSGNMCEAKYYSAKSIGQNIMVTLNNNRSNQMHASQLTNNTGGVSN